MRTSVVIHAGSTMKREYFSPRWGGILAGAVVVSGMLVLELSSHRKKDAPPAEARATGSGFEETADGPAGPHPETGAPLDAAARRAGDRVLGRVRDDAAAVREVRAWYTLGRRPPLRIAALDDLPPSLTGGRRPGDRIHLPWPGGAPVDGRVRLAMRDADGLEVLAGPLVAPREGFFHLERRGDRMHGRLGFRGAETVAVIFPIGDGRHAFVEQRRDLTLCKGAARDLPDLLSGLFNTGVPDVVAGLDPWNLQSHPGAAGVLFLDFDGHVVQNTLWNTEYTDGDPIVVARHEEFTKTSPEYRADWIFKIFNRCKEDFAPFNLNVTTSQAVFDAAPAGRRQRVLITPTSGWYPDDAGGVAYYSTFSQNSDTPCWVWNGGIQWSLPETVSHEVGHTLGLSHSSHDTPKTAFKEYYSGHGLWAPIMGNSFSDERPYTQWDNGFFKGAVNDEDQIGIIAATGSGTNNVGYRSDDRGDTPAAAALLSANAGGVIRADGRLETNGDIDVFRFVMPAGTFDILGESHDPGPNAYLKLTLRHSGYGFLKSTTTAGSQPAHTSHTAAQASTYYLEVTHTGRASSGSDQGFPAYGSLGSYRLEITEPGGDDERPVISAIPAGPVVFGHGTHEFAVVTTDNKAVRIDTLETGDFVVSKGTTIWTPVLVSAGADPDLGARKVRATFQWSPPGGFWDIGDAGSFVATFKSGAVADTNGNRNLISASVGLTVPAADTHPATVTAPAPWPATVPGASAYEFTLKFQDPDTAFVLGSFDGQDIEVRDPAGTPMPVELVGKSASNFSREVLATYRVIPPGGFWDDDDLGTYTVKVVGGQITGHGGAALAETPLGGFAHRAVLLARDMNTDPGFLLEPGWAWGTPTGAGGTTYSNIGNDPAAGYTGSRVLGNNLTGNYAVNAVRRSATSPVFATTGYEGLTLNFWMWLNVNDPYAVEYRLGAGSWKPLLSDDYEFSESWEEVSLALPPECDHQPQVQVRWSIGPTAGPGSLRPLGGWNIDDIQLLAAGKFDPGRVMLSWFPAGRFSLTEGGTRSYSLRLDQDPGAGTPVTVTLSSGRGDTSPITHPATVVLDTTNWQTGRSVTITADQNNRVEGTRSVTLRHTLASANPHFSGSAGPELALTVFDDEAPLIDSQPADRQVPPGTATFLRVTPREVSGALAYQWYAGDSGNISRPIAGATDPVLNLTAGSATGRYWVRVSRTINLFSTTIEDSRTALVSPLTGYPAWKHALLGHGYTQARLEAADFDTADPEADGLGHRLEFALGGQPYSVDTALLPRLVMMEDGPYLFFRRARPELDYTIQISDSPAGPWADFATNPGAVDAAADQQVALPDAGVPARYARLRVGP